MIHMQLLCMSLCGVIVCLCASACVLMFVRDRAFACARLGTAFG